MESDDEFYCCAFLGPNDGASEMQDRAQSIVTLDRDPGAFRIAAVALGTHAA
ncbi:MAG: hypothetical protein ACREYF_01150 [Gammaproteobacteria bacterium]